MKRNDIFDLKRFLFFLKRYLFFNGKGTLTALAAMSGALIVVAVVTSLFGNSINDWMFLKLSRSFIFIGGLVLTSMSFVELHMPERAIQFLTVPASRFEKVLAAWLSTTVFFILAAVVCFSFASLFAGGIAYVLTGASFEVIPIVNDDFWQMLKLYWALHPIFFLGAVYFSGNNFMKTLLSLFVVHTICFVSAIAFGVIMLRDVVFNGNLNNSNFDFGTFAFLDNHFIPMLQFMGYYLLPIFLLVISYVRFNEREA